MTKFFKIIFFILVIPGCSLNDTTGFWSNEKKILAQNKLKPIFKKEEKLINEFNINFSFKFNPLTLKLNKKSYLDNNDGYVNYSGDLQKISKYNFSKIDNYQQIEPDLIFFKNDIIFFDNKGTILSFDNKSKMVWKKNIYSKDEKKLKPLLLMNKINSKLIIADNLSKLYALDITNGKILWSKNHNTPFNSQIKIFEESFFIVDANNNLICYSIKNGEKIWSHKTEKPFINSMKRLSIVVKDNLVIFNNSVGDITALNIKSGMLVWQISTQNTENFTELIDLKTSDLIINNDSVYFSNNKNKFYSIDLKTGSINWVQKINSFIKPSITGGLIFTITEEGYFFIIDKDTGNIIRITNIFKNIKKKRKNLLSPIGFIYNFEDVYISTNDGKLFIMDIENGVIKKIIKEDNKKISRPSVKDNNMYLVKDNSIIKLN